MVITDWLVHNRKLNATCTLKQSADDTKLCSSDIAKLDNWIERARSLKCYPQYCHQQVHKPPPKLLLGARLPARV